MTSKNLSKKQVLINIGMFTAIAAVIGLMITSIVICFYNPTLGVLTYALSCVGFHLVTTFPKPETLKDYAHYVLLLLLWPLATIIGLWALYSKSKGKGR